MQYNGYYGIFLSCHRQPWADWKKMGTSTIWDISKYPPPSGWVVKGGLRRTPLQHIDSNVQRTNHCPKNRREKSAKSPFSLPDNLFTQLDPSLPKVNQEWHTLAVVSCFVHWSCPNIMKQKISQWNPPAALPTTPLQLPVQNMRSAVAMPRPISLG